MPVVAKAKVYVQHKVLVAVNFYPRGNLILSELAVYFLFENVLSPGPVNRSEFFVFV